MPDVMLSENKYLNPCSFVSKHVASVVAKSIARIRPRVPNTGHATVEGTPSIIIKKEHSANNPHKERVCVLRVEFRHSCQCMV